MKKAISTSFRSLLLCIALSVAFVVPRTSHANDSNPGTCARLLDHLQRSVIFLKDAHPYRSREGLSDVQRMAAQWDYYSNLPGNWSHQLAHLIYGLLQVADIIKFRPMPPNLIPLDHPWITGINPQTGKVIWPQNVIFATANTTPGEEDDNYILNKVGRQLKAMVEKSAAVPEIPLGPERRMPHGINYIHGSSHYNSGILIFNNLQEGLQHFSDPRFRDELKRFVKEEKREILIYFRDRNYDLQEYALFVVAIRSVLHWFANSDGPRKPVLWGNTSAYAVVNIITGYWADDVYDLLNPGGLQRVVRPPVANRYFQNGPYIGPRAAGSTFLERVLAYYTWVRILSRGRQGNDSTFDRRLVDRPGSENWRIADLLRDR